MVTMGLIGLHAGASPETAAIGLDLLRATDATLVGTGVRVAHAEVPFSSNDWQVRPSAIGQPVSLFTYYSSGGTSTDYPNALGTESGHANNVAVNFYASPGGVAPGVMHVDNYEGNYFYTSVVTPGFSIPAKVVNQSFIFGTTPPQTTVDTQYDNYAVQRNVLFVSGVGNSGSRIGRRDKGFIGRPVKGTRATVCSGPLLSSGCPAPSTTRPNRPGPTAAALTCRVGITRAFGANPCKSPIGIR